MIQSRYTAYCSMPDSPRGKYDEEIDVDARSNNEALHKVEAIIANGYDKRLRIRRIKKQFGYYL